MVLYFLEDAKYIFEKKKNDKKIIIKMKYRLYKLLVYTSFLLFNLIRILFIVLDIFRLLFNIKKRNYISTIINY